MSVETPKPGHTKRLQHAFQAQAIEDAGAADTSASQNRAGGCSDFTVLIIEDHRDQAESLGFVLQMWGFKAVTVHDGIAGLETALRIKPATVLCDIGLPGLDGFEVARQLTATPTFQAPMAAVTAYGDPETIERCKQVGFAWHFTKPVDLAALHCFLDDRREILLREGR